MIEPTRALGPAAFGPRAAQPGGVQPAGLPSGSAVRVLLVDDSAVVRGAVGRLLDAEPDLSVVATAGNGRQALEALARSPADVVVLDVEMPEMDGLAALPQILTRHPGTRVLMLSVHGGRGAEVTVRALALGAADFVCKPRAAARGGPTASASTSAVPATGVDAYAAELTRKVRALGRSARYSRRAHAPGAGLSGPPHPHPGADAAHWAAPSPTAPPSYRTAAPAPRSAQVLAIASSTGGPVALSGLLGAIPAPLGVPVLVTQHMPAHFTRLLAARLASSTGHACAEARDGEVVRVGHVYIAPGDYHLLAERRGGAVRLRLTQDPPVQHCRPAADPMFASVAAAYGPGALAVVLTGMGHDGRDGAAAIVRRGGRVLAQDEASSVVWGMPGAVAQAGLATAVLPIPQIATHVAACCAARLPATAKR